MEPRDDKRIEPDAVPTTTSTTGSHRQAMRLVRDEREEFVLIYELTGLQVSDPRSLVIEWEGGTKTTRLYHYPANWRQLKDAELLALRPQQDDVRT